MGYIIMGVLEERTQQSILLKCYVVRGDEEVSSIANAILSLIVDNLIAYDKKDDIPDLILDRFELVYNIKYTVEDLEQKLINFGMCYVYPMPYIEDSLDELDQVQDSPI